MNTDFVFLFYIFLERYDQILNTVCAVKVRSKLIVSSYYL